MYTCKSFNSQSYGAEGAQPGFPTQQEMNSINEFALEPLKPADVYVRRMSLANTQYDRDFERFPVEYLQQFAKTIKGKSVLANHDEKGEPLGRFFSAHVVKQANDHVLVPSFYMVRTSENDGLRKQIDAGIRSHASIGFKGHTLLCDICGKDYDAFRKPGASRDNCPHLKGEEYGGKTCTGTYGGDVSKVEAVEGSLVFLGAQEGAAISKMQALQSGLLVPDKRVWQLGGVGGVKGTMDEAVRQKLASLETQNKQLQAQVSQQAGVARQWQQKAALLEPLAADGELYRRDLAQEYVRLGTWLQQPERCKQMLQANPNMTAEQLRALVKEQLDIVDQMFPPQPVREEVSEQVSAPPLRMGVAHRLV